MKEWTVHEYGTSSDHRILATRLDFGKRNTMPPHQERRYNTRIANWEVFQTVVIEDIEALGETTLQQAEDVERMAGQLQAFLIRACDVAIPKEEMTLQVSALVDALALLSKKEHLPGKKKIPKG